MVKLHTEHGGFDDCLFFVMEAERAGAPKPKRRFVPPRSIDAVPSTTKNGSIYLKRPHRSYFRRFFGYIKRFSKIFRKSEDFKKASEYRKKKLVMDM